MPKTNQKNINTMPTYSHLLLLILLLLNHNSSASNTPTSWPPTHPPEPHNSTEFIKTRCQATLYPDLCFSSLARYASSVHCNPLRLARIAAKLAFSQIHTTKAHLSTLYLRAPSPPLTDCIDSLGNAMDQARKSATEIGKLDEGVVGPEVAWRVANAQTWMSAALTNEETCMDGFDETAEGWVKADVCGRVGRVKQYTSNTLALVNGLVNGR